MEQAELKEIAVDLIYNYLNNPSKYSKNKIEINYNSAITILTKKLNSFFCTNPTIRQMQQGSRSVTYKDISLDILTEEIKLLLPKPKRCIAYV